VMPAVRQPLFTCRGKSQVGSMVVVMPAVRQPLLLMTAAPMEQEPSTGETVGESLVGMLRRPITMAVTLPA